jgi:hypothetical protein
MSVGTICRRQIIIALSGAFAGPVFAQGPNMESEYPTFADKSAVDWLLLFLGFALWLLYWRLLRRWARRHAFIWWFPTAMVALVALSFWIGDHTTTRQVVSIAAIWMNYPVFIAFMILHGFGLWPPDWLQYPVMLGSIWIAWHSAFRYTRSRALLDAPPSGIQIYPGGHK